MSVSQLMVCFVIDGKLAWLSVASVVTGGVSVERGYEQLWNPSACRAYFADGLAAACRTPFVLIELSWETSRYSSH